MRHLWYLFALVVLLCPLLAQAEYRLTWDYTQGSTVLVSFRVYRQYDCTGDFTPLIDVIVVDEPYRAYSYADDTAAPGEHYCWKVTGVDGLGQESPATNVVEFVGVPAVSQPTNLRGGERIAMADVHVVISAGEEEASGLSSPEIIYTDATGEEAEEALLRVSRGDHVLTEFPAGRYVSWETV